MTLQVLVPDLCEERGTASCAPPMPLTIDSKCELRIAQRNQMACTGHIVDSLLSVEQTTDLDAADVDTTVTNLGPKLP